MEHGISKTRLYSVYLEMKRRYKYIPATSSEE